MADSTAFLCVFGRAIRVDPKRQFLHQRVPLTITTSLPFAVVAFMIFLPYSGFWVLLQRPFTQL